MAVTNSVVTTGKQSIGAYLERVDVKASLLRSLQNDKAIQIFTSSICSAVTANPELGKCNPQSVISAGLQAVALNLAINQQLGFAYLVPYGETATFIPGWRGYVQLAQRTGLFADIDAYEIREGEYLGKDAVTGKPTFRFIEDDAIREELPVVGYMAYFELLNGFKKRVYWSKEKVQNHALQFSKGYAADVKKGTKFTFWSKNFDDMAKKTVMLQLLKKYAPLSIDMQSAIANEEREDQPSIIPESNAANALFGGDNAPEHPAEEKAQPENIDTLQDTFFGKANN